MRINKEQLKIKAVRVWFGDILVATFILYLVTPCIVYLPFYSAIVFVLFCILFC